MMEEGSAVKVLYLIIFIKRIFHSLQKLQISNVAIKHQKAKSTSFTNADLKFDEAVCYERQPLQNLVIHRF